MRRALAAVLAMIAADIAAAAPDWVQTDSGLRYAVTSHGQGPAVHDGQVIVAHYKGRLADGREFDSSVKRKQPIAFTLGSRQVIRGWDEGFALLHVGDKATLVIPPDLAYGERGRPPLIPENATLTFDVELLAYHDHALADTIAEALAKGGLDEARRRYGELERTAFSGYYVDEAQLNGLGYRLMAQDKMDAAIAVLEWTVARFPGSANALDSLGEVLAKSGDRDRAMASYRKALEIDPSFANAAQELKRLESAATPQPRKTVSTLDLVSLKEIGGYSGNLALSPNGKAVAFQVQQADLAARTYKVDWLVVPTDGSSKVVNVGDGGELMLNPNPFGRVNGSRAEIKAEWSPDGQWIAYLRKYRGEVQVWRSRADGSMQEQMTHNAADVMSFKWNPEGETIYFTVGRDREWMRASDLQEADQGYLLDDRFSPFESLGPKWSACGEAPQWGIPPPASQLCKPATWVVKAGEKEREASAPEDEGSNASSSPHRPPGLDPKRQPQNVAWDSRGDRAAWFESEDPAVYPGVGGALILFAGPIRCSLPECRGQLRRAWWHGDEVVFLRREGHSFSIPALYAWTPGAQTARLIYRLDGTLESCEQAGGEMICLHEAPTTPRKVVAIDLAKGALRTVWDPNPEFQRFLLGSVERIEWHDAFGNDTFGHLVYPPDYAPGRRYPLVIVQYRSRGFLKGGVGDEFPIFPLAANGFLVLSFDGPEDRNLMTRCRFDTVENMKACVAGEYKDLYRLRRKLSALEVVLDQLQRRGLVDADKVGITGLSDGAETVDFALIRSKRFAAAATTGTWWSNFYQITINDAERGLIRDLQKPSISDNAALVSAPLLIQVSDAELIATAPSFTALRDAHKAVEAFVFPNEYHIKWQPQHKLAAARRTIDWFRFWLKGEQDPDPAKASQYARWSKMRIELVR